MFNWTFDAETNGLLLTEGRALTRNSELMPVYATELHLFGLHEKIGIPEETGTPIAWYKRGAYYYEGRKFARRRDAEIELLQAPTPQGAQMQPVDLDGMRRKNAALLSQLEGTSAEIWIYLLAHGAKINQVYRYGHHRACCLVCPFSSPFEVEITKRMAREQIEPYRQEYLRQFPGHEAHFDRRYKGDDGTWSRVNSQALHGDFPILDRLEDNIYKYILPENYNINSHWLELARRKYEFKLYQPRGSEYIIVFYTLKHTNANKLFKNILNRAFYCVSCGYCINYCIKGAIKILNMTGGKIHIIQDKCDNCLECVKSECIRAKALRGFRGNEA